MPKRDRAADVTPTPSTLAREAAEAVQREALCIHPDDGHTVYIDIDFAALAIDAALRAAVAQAEAERDEARAELLAALKEAREDIDHWGSYASEYFQEKWHFADTVRGYDDRIAALSPAAPEGTAPTRPGDDALTGR